VNFTSHNILLPDGTQTLPGQLPVAESGICRVALSALGLEFGYGSRSGISVADLGCLEGGFTAEFARAGYDAYGIEARQENYVRYCRARSSTQCSALACSITSTPRWRS
jgi:2-polyprenyl-3-methyl-5-hydroxy-6-metoxy-1,4-benzoquinol methylase